LLFDDLDTVGFQQSAYARREPRDDLVFALHNRGKVHFAA
jgi:hypothetical protein